MPRYRDDRRSQPGTKRHGERLHHEHSNPKRNRNTHTTGGAIDWSDLTGQSKESGHHQKDVQFSRNKTSSRNSKSGSDSLSLKWEELCGHDDSKETKDEGISINWQDVGKAVASAAEPQDVKRKGRDDGVHFNVGRQDSNKEVRSRKEVSSTSEDVGRRGKKEQHQSNEGDGLSFSWDELSSQESNSAQANTSGQNASLSGSENIAVDDTSSGLPSSSIRPRARDGDDLSFSWEDVEMPDSSRDRKIDEELELNWSDTRTTDPWQPVGMGNNDDNLAVAPVAVTKSWDRQKPSTQHSRYDVSDRHDNTSQRFVQGGRHSHADISPIGRHQQRKDNNMASFTPMSNIRGMDFPMSEQGHFNQNFRKEKLRADHSDTLSSNFKSPDIPIFPHDRNVDVASDSQQGRPEQEQTTMRPGPPMLPLSHGYTNDPEYGLTELRLARTQGNKRGGLDSFSLKHDENQTASRNNPVLPSLMSTHQKPVTFEEQNERRGFFPQQRNLDVHSDPLQQQSRQDHQNRESSNLRRDDLQARNFDVNRGPPQGQSGQGHQNQESSNLRQDDLQARNFGVNRGPPQGQSGQGHQNQESSNLRLDDLQARNFDVNRGPLQGQSGQGHQNQESSNLRRDDLQARNFDVNRGPLQGQPGQGHRNQESSNLRRDDLQARNFDVNRGPLQGQPGQGHRNQESSNLRRDDLQARNFDINTSSIQQQPRQDHRNQESANFVNPIIPNVGGMGLLGFKRDSLQGTYGNNPIMEGKNPAIQPLMTMPMKSVKHAKPLFPVIKNKEDKELNEFRKFVGVVKGEQARGSNAIATLNEICTKFGMVTKMNYEVEDAERVGGFPCFCGVLKFGKYFLARCADHVKKHAKHNTFNKSISLLRKLAWSEILNIKDPGMTAAKSDVWLRDSVTKGLVIHPSDLADIIDVQRSLEEQVTKINSYLKKPPPIVDDPIEAMAMVLHDSECEIPMKVLVKKETTSDCYNVAVALGSVILSSDRKDDIEMAKRNAYRSALIALMTKSISAIMKGPTVESFVAELFGKLIKPKVADAKNPCDKYMYYSFEEKLGEMLNTFHATGMTPDIVARLNTIIISKGLSPRFIYRFANLDGDPMEHKLFICEFYVNTLHIATGEGTTKKNAYNDAFSIAGAVLMRSTLKTLITEHKQLEGNGTSFPGFIDSFSTGESFAASSNLILLQERHVIPDPVGNPLKNLVICELASFREHSHAIAYNTLEQSATKSHMLITCEMENINSQVVCTIRIQDEVVSKVSCSCKSAAKVVAALRALVKLAKTQDIYRIHFARELQLETAKIIPWSEILAEDRKRRSSDQKNDANPRVANRAAIQRILPVLTERVIQEINSGHEMDELYIGPDPNEGACKELSKYLFEHEIGNFRCLSAKLGDDEYRYLSRKLSSKRIVEILKENNGQYGRYQLLDRETTRICYQDILINASSLLNAK